MADPYSRSLPTPWPFAPGGNGGADHVTGMASGVTIAIGVFSPAILSQPVGDIILPVWTVTTGSGTINGTISRYIITSEPNTPWTGGLSPTSAADQTAALTALFGYDSGAQNAMLLDQLTVSAANTAYYFRELVSLYARMGNLPSNTSILIQNNSGAALSSTAANFSITYSIDSYT